MVVRIEILFECQHHYEISAIFIFLNITGKGIMFIEKLPVTVQHQSFFQLIPIKQTINNPNIFLIYESMRLVLFLHEIIYKFYQLVFSIYQLENR